MPPIRILVADASPLVRGAVDEAASQDGDLAVIGEAHGPVELLVRAVDVDVVVLQVDGDDVPRTAERLIDETPRIGIVGVDGDVAHGLVYRLRPQTRRIGPITTRALIAAIREAAPSDLSPASTRPHAEGT